MNRPIAGCLFAFGFMFLLSTSPSHAEHEDAGDASRYVPEPHPTAPTSDAKGSDVQRRTADLDDVQEEEARLQETKDIEHMRELKEAIDTQLTLINRADSADASTPAAVGEAAVPRFPTINSFIPDKRN